jgi:hypothetical protein
MEVVEYAERVRQVLIVADEWFSLFALPLFVELVSSRPN